jgi:tetratricopeptide (TPR) repeat protein
VALSPREARRNDAKLIAVPSSLAEQVLAHAQAGREVIQDFCPLAESLEWELGQEYLRERGNKAFISDASPVPFVINNDGTLSRNAADVFFASLLAADEEGTLEPDIFVLELGIGVGLFARYFLDHFQEMCIRLRKDYYDRLCYIAADRSQRMLMDVLRHGIFANHPGRYRVRLVDALKPEELLPGDAMFLGHPGKPLRAVFLNYLLDCLPATVLEIDGDEVRQLCVRTCLARNIRLADRTDMSTGYLRQKAQSKNPAVRHELLEVYGLFASEYDYQPVNVDCVPYGRFAVEFGRTRTRNLLVNYGAIQCLEKLLTLLNEQGFILMNEYGFTQQSRERDFEHQRFSQTTAVGLNFSLLKAYFGESERCQWLEASGDNRGIHSRLMGHKPAHDTVTRFAERFSDSAHARLQEPVEQARAAAKAGRFESAATFYHQGLRLQPRNWLLLAEISSFLTFHMRDPKSGIDMAKAALALNPTCSAELWNTLGDGLFEFGRTAEARSAYEKALAVNAGDVRARYNLAWIHAREKDFPGALVRLAEALALDRTGAFRERLLQKQQEILAQLSGHHQQEYLLLTNLVSRYAPERSDRAPKDQGRKGNSAPSDM